MGSESWGSRERGLGCGWGDRPLVRRGAGLRLSRTPNRQSPDLHSKCRGEVVHGPLVDLPPADPTDLGSRPLLPSNGSANPAVQKASGRGSTLQSDQPGNLPDQLRRRYPQTQFEFTKPGVAGQYVKFVGGTHPMSGLIGQPLRFFSGHGRDVRLVGVRSPLSAIGCQP